MTKVWSLDDSGQSRPQAHLVIFALHVYLSLKSNSSKQCWEGAERKFELKASASGESFWCWHNWFKVVWFGKLLAYLSHCRRVQLAMIQSDTMKTSSTVPGQIVIKVFITNRVLKLIRLSAPIEREDASVNNLECKSITL